jgi:hypothetical protein
MTAHFYLLYQINQVKRFDLILKTLFAGQVEPTDFLLLLKRRFGNSRGEGFRKWVASPRGFEPLSPP